MNSSDSKSALKCSKKYKISIIFNYAPKIPKSLLRMHLNSLKNKIIALCGKLCLKRLLLEASSQMSVKYQKGLQFRINSNSIKSNKSLFLANSPEPLSKYYKSGFNNFPFEWTNVFQFCRDQTPYLGLTNSFTSDFI